MRIHALATDYDGTLARAGVVAKQTRAALERVRASGRRVILVSGRELDDLTAVYPDLTDFDMVVAENGAVLFDPVRQEATTLAEPPPAALTDALKQRKVPFSTGRVIIATEQPHEVELLQAIRDLGLEWEVVFNKGSVMGLPSGTNKSSGLLTALERLGISAHNVAGIGDAENDHSFLRLCEIAVAVGNALPAIKQRADLVMRRNDGGGVAEFIDRFLLEDLGNVPRVFDRYQFEMGTRRSGSPVRLPVYGSNLLVLGSSGSGKSTLSGLMIERLTDQGYQVCAIDPEGDHAGLEPLVMVGSNHARPAVQEVTLALERNPAGAIVNLVSMNRADKVRLAADLLSAVFALRSALGRPRWLLIDEAHHLLPTEETPGGGVLPDGVDGVAMVTLEPGLLGRSALDNVTHLVVIGEDPAGQLRDFAAARGLRRPAPEDLKNLDLMEGEAVAVAVRDGSLGRPQRFRVAPRRSEHRRHVRKYARGDLEDRSFYFRGPQDRLNLRAYNVHAFSEMARGVDLETWSYHFQRGDYSRWFQRRVKDTDTAARIAEIEARADELGAEQSREQVLRLVDARYTGGE